MTTQFAVRAEKLSKRYRLGAAVQGRLTESLWEAFESPFRRFRPERARRDFIWALRDVSFEVGQGEVVGFIGRNGAGKSTLLKILSRITEPTAGYAEIRGRMGSLIEVGSGFHPDLTGRENVFLYGTVLGMRKRTVRAKFDEIVSFAGVERFIDTPVKRYSSGMYMRLAFAVAAHLEPQILVVDEVLSVGDWAFQKKCLGKMEEAATSGRTVLFVSHNMSAVEALCSRAFLLEEGWIVAAGPAREVVRRYLDALELDQHLPLRDRRDRHGDGSVRLTELRVRAADGGTISSTSRLAIDVDYEGNEPLRLPRFQVTINDESHNPLYLLDTDLEGGLPDVLPAAGTVRCVTDPIRLTPGKCGLMVGVRRGGMLADGVEFAGVFEIAPAGFFESGRMPRQDEAAALLHHSWTLVPRQPSLAASVSEARA